MVTNSLGRFVGCRVFGESLSLARRDSHSDDSLKPQGGFQAAPLHPKVTSRSPPQ
ncbi:hypothetical protein L914_19604, partial [Phytophthora nicotianae]